MKMNFKVIKKSFWILIIIFKIVDEFQHLHTKFRKVTWISGGADCGLVGLWFMCGAWLRCSRYSWLFHGACGAGHCDWRRAVDEGRIFCGCCCGCGGGGGFGRLGVSCRSTCC